MRSEHEEQKAVIAWAKVMESQIPKLRLLYAVLHHRQEREARSGGLPHTA